MALDIAPAPPQASPALPPAANAPPPTGDIALVFAKLLAKSVQATAASPEVPGASPADETTGPAPHDRKTEKEDPDSTDALLQMQALPPSPPALPSPVPVLGLALNVPETTTGKTQEAMDTRPVLTPAIQGEAKNGGELLPQTAQPDTSITAQAAATDVGTKLKGTALSIREQNALQINVKPANNTGIAATQLSASVAASHEARLVSEDLLSRLTSALQKPNKTRDDLQDAPAPPLASVGLQTAQNTTRALAPQLPTESRAALVTQASEAVQSLRVQASANGQGQMTLQLHPHDWGRLQVSVTMTPASGPDGGTIVTAHLVAESHAVRTALEGQASELKQALSDAGLKLENLSVTVRSVEAGAEAQSSNNDTQGRESRNTETWAQGQSSFSNPGGGNAFSGQQGSGFYAPPSLRGALLSEEINSEPSVTITAKAATQGIDMRA